MCPKRWHIVTLMRMKLSIYQFCCQSWWDKGLLIVFQNTRTFWGWSINHCTIESRLIGTCTRSAYYGKSDCLVLAKNLAFYTKSGKRVMCLNLKVTKTLWRSRGSSKQRSDLDAACLKTPKTIFCLTILMVSSLNSPWYAPVARTIGMCKRNVVSLDWTKMRVRMNLQHLIVPKITHCCCQGAKKCKYPATDNYC